MLLSLWAALLLYLSDYFGSLFDRAFVYFRMLDNLQAGCGVSFNCHKAPVTGFISSLHLGVMWLGTWIEPNKEALSQYLGLAAMGGAMTLALFIVRAPKWHRHNLANPLVASMTLFILLCFDHFLLAHMLSGTETALTCLVVMALFWSVQQPGQPLLQLWLLLVALLHPLGLLFWLAAPMFSKARERQFWLPIIGIYLGLALLRTFLGGDAFFNSLWTWSTPSWHFWQLLLVLAHFPWILLAPLALLNVETRRATLFTLRVAAGWLVIAAIFGLQASVYDSTLVPILLPLAVLAVVGTLAACERLSEHFKGWQRASLPWTILTVAICYTLVCWASSKLPHTHITGPLAAKQSLGNYLKERYPKATLAATSYGSLGYYSHLTTYPIKPLQEQPSPPPVEDDYYGLMPNPPQPTRQALAPLLQKAPKLILLSRWRTDPWSSLDSLRAPFPSEQALLSNAQQKKIPYKLLNAEAQPGQHWLFLQHK